MRISFDLDGVIADGHHWFFRIIEGMRKIDPEQAELAGLEYYSSRPLKYHPNLFLAFGDEGIIVTARKPKAEKITMDWLERYGIVLPVYFCDRADQLNWKSYAAAARESAKLKAKVIQEQKIEVHFDNNPVLVGALRKILPELKVILVGGGREII